MLLAISAFRLNEATFAIFSLRAVRRPTFNRWSAILRPRREREMRNIPFLEVPGHEEVGHQLVGTWMLGTRMTLVAFGAYHAPADDWGSRQGLDGFKSHNRAPGDVDIPLSPSLVSTR